MGAGDVTGEKNYSLLDKALEKYVDTLNVTEAEFKTIRERYEAIGTWLEREGSSFQTRHPKIFVQGSLLLGTAIRRCVDNASLDVDLVCSVDYGREEISQRTLKELLQKELLLYVKAKGMKSAPKEKKRCWTLEYQDGLRFHADILPAIPDSDMRYQKYLLESGIRENVYKTGIYITDNTLPNYARIDSNWQRSNPIGYASWFRERMKFEFEKAAASLLERRLYASVEDIPNYEVKTPLQKSIQFLKWHRDVMFESNLDDKPISIIISTLSAHAYQNEAMLVDALQRIVADMDKYIEVTRAGVCIIKNPVRPDENFADKWEGKPVLKDNFYKWLKKVRQDLKDAFLLKDEKEVIECLGISLGKVAMQKVLENSGYGAKRVVSTILTYPEVKINPTKQWGCDGGH